MSFATGFFKTAADRVTARKEYIRDKRAKDRDYQGLRFISRVNLRDYAR